MIYALCILVVLLGFAVAALFVRSRRAARDVAISAVDKAVDETKRRTAEKVAEAERDTKKAEAAVREKSDADLEREINK